MDQQVRTYSCKRQTRRWPMVIFYNMIDIAALNAFIAFTKEHPNYQKDVSHKRRIFLKELAKELVIPNMVKRSQNPKLQRSVKERMKNFIPISQSNQNYDDSTA